MGYEILSTTMMSTLVDSGTLPVTDRFRRDRWRNVQALLEPLREQPYSLARYAVARALLFSLEATEFQRLDDALATLAPWLPQLSAPRFDGPVTLDRAQCVAVSNAMLDDEAFVPRILGGSHIGDSSFGGALRLLHAIQLDRLVLANCGAVVSLGPQAPNEDLRSYTLTVTPNMVYAEVARDPLSNAETLVHESSHNLLNDLLRESGAEVRGASTYSPWKEAKRPPFGIIHATFAFTMLITLWTRLLEGDSVPVDRHHELRIKVTTQVMHLKGVMPTIATFRDSAGRGDVLPLILSCANESIDRAGSLADARRRSV
jgi:hypothetical protein